MNKVEACFFMKNVYTIPNCNNKISCSWFLRVWETKITKPPAAFPTDKAYIDQKSCKLKHTRHKVTY